MDEFERGRRAGIAASAARLEQEAEKCVSPNDMPYGAELRLHAGYVRALADNPSTILVGERRDLERACAALRRVAPEVSCPFCEERPCGSCMERARMAGELRSTLDLLSSWLAEAKQ
jgi:hypothetical protein